MDDVIGVAIARIEEKLDHLLDSMEDHESRIRAIEGKSGKRWESLMGQIISLVIAAACGVLLGKNY